MAIPGVVGTGEARREGLVCVLVMVTRQTPEVVALIPAEIEGIPVVVQEVGTIRALGGDRGPGPGPDGLADPRTGP